MRSRFRNAGDDDLRSRQTGDQGIQGGDNAQERPFQKPSENHEQPRRVPTPLGCDLIENELKKSLDRIWTTRRERLHLWSGVMTSLLVTPSPAADALGIVTFVLADPVRNEKLVPNQWLVRYLCTKGAPVAGILEA